MSIRPADGSDVAAITRIVSRAYGRYVERIGRPPVPMLDDYAGRVRRHQAWVADDRGAVVGLIVLIRHSDHLLLDNIAVDPAAQGRGIGRALLAFAESEAKRRGYAELRLYTHATMTENIALYAALGWHETGRAVQEGYSRVFFRKPVN